MLGRNVKKVKSKKNQKTRECDESHIYSRLHRIQGQVVGIERMLEEKRDCVSIIQQIVAAREALDKAAILILENEAQGCFGKKDNKKALQDLQRIIAASFKAL